MSRVRNAADRIFTLRIFFVPTNQYVFSFKLSIHVPFIFLLFLSCPFVFLLFPFMSFYFRSFPFIFLSFPFNLPLFRFISFRSLSYYNLSFMFLYFLHSFHVPLMVLSRSFHFPFCKCAKILQLEYSLHSKSCYHAVVPCISFISLISFISFHVPFIFLSFD